MRVAYVKAPFQFELREMEIPRPGEGQILLDVRACAVCGTDMHTAALEAVEYTSFGHEIAGVVLETGSGVHRLQPGDKVAVESGTFCHVCENCRNGRTDLCTNGKSIIDDVAVVGLGPIGLMTIALAKAAGARNIYAIQKSDRSKARIELAKKLGATVILTKDTDLNSYPFPRGGLNKIMVTAGPSVIPEMFKIAVYGGIISFLGIDMANGNITFNANDFHFKKLQLRASYAAPALWFPRALDLLKNKVVDPDDFITQTFPLEEIQKWFEKQRDDSSDVIKMVMVKEEMKDLSCRFLC